MNEAGNIEGSVNYFQKFKLPQSFTILDIGTHFGSFVAELDKLGYCNSQGIDLDKVSISKGIERYPYLSHRLKYYDGLNLPYQSGYFDIITMFDVIEHIPNIVTFLHSEVLRVLKNGGFLIFQTPNLLTNVPWEVIQHKSLTGWRQYHCSLQTFWSLRNILQNAGFTDINIERFDLLSEYNHERIRHTFGRLRPLILSLVKLNSILPIGAITNFWGICQKPNIVFQVDKG